MTVSILSYMINFHFCCLVLTFLSWICVLAETTFVAVLFLVLFRYSSSITNWSYSTTVLFPTFCCYCCYCFIPFCIIPKSTLLFKWPLFFTPYRFGEFEWFPDVK